MRPPAVAGQFYAGEKSTLKKQIEKCFNHVHGPGFIPDIGKGPRQILGLVSPHAGYPYSGPIAAHGFARLAEDGKPGSIILLGPNHQGIGSGISIMTQGKWSTPMGEIDIDKNLAEKILNSIDIIDEDEISHSREHSIEVQIPFLQYVFGSELNIVPICMMMQDDETIEEIGKGIGSILSETIFDNDVLIIASTDFTHYESQDTAVSNDRKAIDKILNLDWKGLIDTISQENISMCGYGPVSTMLKAVKELGSKQANLLKYATSGDVTGAMSQVVGYSSIEVLE